MTQSPSSIYQDICQLQLDYAPDTAKVKAEELLTSFMGANYQIGRDKEKASQLLASREANK